MGWFWSKESESDDNKEDGQECNTNTPYSNSTYLNNNINNNNINNNASTSQQSSEVPSFLGEKRKRPISQSQILFNNDNNILDSQNKIKKCESDIQRQTIINNQNQKLISELKKENEALKQENEKNKIILNNYNKKFEKIENEIEIKITEALNKINNEKEKNNNQVKNIINNAMKQYQIENDQKLNSLIKKIPEKMEKDLNKKVEELENLYYDKNKNDINEIHTGIKCDKCQMYPIIGIRYKCLLCQNYNLCEKCERQNCRTREHDHIFLKYIKNENQIKLNEKEEEENNNEKNNNINDKYNNNKYNNSKNEIKQYSYNYYVDNYLKKNNIREEDRDINNTNYFKETKIISNSYSYQCLTDDLYFSVLKGTKNEVRFNLLLKNNGKTAWPENNSFLVSDSSMSDINVRKTILTPLSPGKECSFSIYFDNLNNLKPGKYKTYLDFKVYNKNYGEKILITFEILELKINPLVANFRGEYSIDENTLSDEVIQKALESNNNDFSKTFQSLYQ